MEIDWLLLIITGGISLLCIGTSIISAIILKQKPMTILFLTPLFLSGMILHSLNVIDASKEPVRLIMILFMASLAGYVLWDSWKNKKQAKANSQ